MACTYILGNKNFDSELELDDFLLSNGHLTSAFGDAVFSNPDLPIDKKGANLEVITKKIKEDVKELKELDKIKKATTTYIDDEGVTQYEKPYAGVTQFLSGLKIGDEYLFPEFRPDEFWNKRRGDWKDGNFTKEEAELIFGFNDEGKANPTSPITDVAIQDEWIKKIERKWDYQGVVGRMIHEGMKVYFDKVIHHETATKENIKLELQKLLNTINNEDGRRREGKPIYTFEELIPNENDILESILESAKILDQNLKNRFGSDIYYFTELGVKGTLNQTTDDGIDTIYGMIDLLVLDKNGGVHVIDYKTSPKNYNSSEYSKVKKLAYSHLLATYRRILEQYGLNNHSNRALVVPIQLSEFKPTGDSDGKYTYSKVVLNKTEAFDDITDALRLPNTRGRSAVNNISNFINVREVGVFMPEKALQHIKDITEAWFPTYNAFNEMPLDEEIMEELKDKDCFTPNSDGYLVYNIPGSNSAPIVVSATEEGAETKLFEKVKELKKHWIDNRSELVKDLFTTLNEVHEGRLSLDKSSFINELQGRQRSKSYGVDSSWLYHKLSNYINPNIWEVVLDDELNSYLIKFSMIALRNKRTNAVDIIRVSPRKLNYRQTLAPKRKTLIGAFDEDVVQKSKQDNLVVDSYIGNIEAMECLLVLNEVADFFQNNNIGQIQVINPYDGYTTPLTQEELWYNFNELTSHKDLETNNFKNGRLRIISTYEICRQLYEDALYRNLATKGEEFGELNDIISVMEDPHNQALKFLENNESDMLKVEQLKRVANLLESDRAIGVKLNNIDTESLLSDPIVKLYSNIMQAIALLSSVPLKQQIADHEAYISGVKMLSLQYMGNPGNLANEVLNSSTRAVLEAYQNVRVDMQEPTNKIQKLVENLKKELGYNRLKDATIGLPRELYKDMIDPTYKDDFVMYDSSDVTYQSLKEFIDYFLWEVNKQRYPRKSNEELLQMRSAAKGTKDYIAYHRIPIKNGKAGLSSKGWEASLKNFITKFDLRTWGGKIQKEYQEAKRVFNSDPTDHTIEDLYTLQDEFARSLNDREVLIEGIGRENIEMDLEEIFLLHTYNLSLKENMDYAFPIIKAAMLFIKNLAANANQEFKMDTTYLEDYIKSTIKKEKIMNKREQYFLKKITGPLRHAATIASLVLSPVQYLYQRLLEIWNDISLAIRKPDGTQAFSAKNIGRAWLIVQKDAMKGDKSILRSVNKLYSINDMDMNRFIDRIKTNQGGLRNFENLLMKFPSSPDFYSRSTILVSQMTNDGCWEAHYLNEDGLLVYDMSKDARYSLLNGTDTNSPEYLKLKSLYIANAKQFMREKAKYTNGTEFILNMDEVNRGIFKALPRAYTTLESESMKEISDNIYGYYTHEKKALVLSLFLGTMWMQFKTYWSGKRNLYMAPGGVKLRGHWKVVEGYCINEDGEIEKINEDGSNDTGVPVTQWVGDWQEGIFVTIKDILTGADGTLSLKEIKKNFNEKIHNPDERLRRAYINNLKLLTIDLTMWIIIGNLVLGTLMRDWLKDVKEENEDEGVIGAAKIAAAQIVSKSVLTSLVDFNFVETVTDPLVQWSPLSIEWMGKTLHRTLRVAQGKEDIISAMMKSTSVGKMIYPIYQEAINE